jgi:MFS family permease
VPHINTKSSVKKDTLPGAWVVVALLFFVGTLNYLDRSTITTMHMSITNAFAINDAQFGLLTSVFLWTYGILSPFAGFLADKFSRSRVIVGSLFVWSVVTLLTGFAETFGQLLTTRALMGISEACYIPAALALISDYHRGSTRSLATGINMVGIMIGSSLGFIGGWIAEKHHWSLAFHIFGIIGIIYSLVVMFMLHDVPAKKENLAVDKKIDEVNLWEAIKSLFSNGSFILMLVFWGLLGAVGWILIGWLPTYYQAHFHLSQSMAGVYATAYFYPAAIAGALIGGFLADRWSKVNVRGRILVPVIGLCIAAPGIFIASDTNILTLAVIFFVIYSLTRMFSDANMMPVLRLVANKRYSATGYGIMNLIATVIGGIGIYAGGTLRDYHINLSFTFKIAAALLIICAILLYLVKPKQELIDAKAE